jgi:heptosyltransferase-1
MTQLAQREFRRILIIKPSSPGDIIHALPVLHALRRRFPAAHIAWLVATPFADLIAADPAVSEVIPYDRSRFGRLGRSGLVTRDFVRFVLELRRRRFDLVIDLQGLFRSGFLAWACGAEVRLGFADAREFAPLFYSSRVRDGRLDRHAADHNFLVVPAVGASSAAMDFSIALTAEDRRAAAELLAEAGIAASDYAVLVPATRWETKCWPAERFGELAARLRDEAGLRSVLVGGRDDIAAGNAASAASGGAAFNACGRTTLRQLAALIDGARIVVTGDSTPMHLAAALDRPLVALFGPTNPRRTGPYGRLADVLRLELDCSPCYLKRLSECPYNHACMQRLEIETVTAAALARIAVRAPVGAP